MSATTSVDSVDTDKCPHCRRTFYTRDKGSPILPRMLPCFDTFCSDCLKAHVTDLSSNHPWSPIACPLCRTAFQIPGNGGIDALPENTYVRHVVKTIQMTAPPNDKLFCDACDDGVSKAEIYCVRCDEKLCHTCGEVHRKLKATKNHKTLKVGSTEAGALVQMWKENPPLCQEHTRETVEYYCIPCSKGVCKSCQEQHESHKEKMEKVNTISTKMRKVISDKSVDIAEKQKEWKNKEKQNDEIYNMSMDNIASVENSVEEKAELLHRQIDAGRDLLIGKLNDLKTRHQLELVRARDTVDGELQKISRFMKISQDISIKSDVASLISYYPEWHKRKQALLSNRITDDLRLVRVHLTDSFWEQEYISSENFIGELSVDPSETNAVDK